VTLADVYGYLAFLARDRERSARSSQTKYGLSATSRARKIATIRSFFKYLTLKTKQLDVNPVAELDSPKTKKTLPRFLSLEESTRLLLSVEGPNRDRDFCILTQFLKMRAPDLRAGGLASVQRADSIRVLGKGGKERLVYLNDACADAINDYLLVRRGQKAVETRAFFLSARRERISTSTVHYLVKRHLSAAGLDSSKYSSHKLRHTAATLMLRNGVDVRTLQELLGHEHLNTTQIYTHVESDSLREAAPSPLSTYRQAVKTTKNPDKTNVSIITYYRPALLYYFTITRPVYFLSRRGLVFSGRLNHYLSRSAFFRDDEKLSGDVVLIFKSVGLEDQLRGRPVLLRQVPEGVPLPRPVDNERRSFRGVGRARFVV
jgi:site-specific recombinase XerD